LGKEGKNVHFSVSIVYLYHVAPNIGLPNKPFAKHPDAKHCPGWALTTTFTPYTHTPARPHTRTPVHTPVWRRHATHADTHDGNGVADATNREEFDGSFFTLF
jgi:hypothetical protein